MALKSYLVDPYLVGIYLSPIHTVTIKGYTTQYRLIEGDSELDIKKQRMGGNTREIYIGQRVFSTEDETLQRFIESKPYFGDKIKEYDPIAENKKKLEAEKRSVSLLMKVTQFKRDKIMEAGYALFGREAMEYIRNEDISGLHSKIIHATANDFEKVDTILNNKDNSVRLFAGFLIASGIFEVTIDDRHIVWSDNQSKIYTAPQGVDILDGFVEYLQTKEGQEIKKEASIRLETMSIGSEGETPKGESSEDSESATGRGRKKS